MATSNPFTTSLSAQKGTSTDQKDFIAHCNKSCYCVLKTAFSSTPGKKRAFSTHSKLAVSLPFGSNLHFNLFGLLLRIFCTLASPSPPASTAFQSRKFTALYLMSTL